MNKLDVILKTKNFNKYQKTLFINLIKFKDQQELSKIVSDLNDNSLMINLDSYNYCEYLTDLFRLSFFNTIDFIKLNNLKLDDQLLEELKLTITFISNTINKLFWTNIDKLFDAKNNLVNKRAYQIKIRDYLFYLYSLFKKITNKQLLNIISNVVNVYLLLDSSKNNQTKLDKLTNNLTNILNLIEQSFLDSTKKLLEEIYQTFELLVFKDQQLKQTKNNFYDFLNNDLIFRSNFKNELEALEFLGLTNNTSWNEIKKRYKLLAVRYHPDNNKNEPVAEEMMQKLNNAYNLLKSKKNNSI
ncbi:J domain-containing protein [Mycoplasma putrefaciens]|uniref:J domain-containing protein n=1 Tax=Mycoplasma putrefaciens Mput9231 TaxID=1292033 RepID=M9W9W4_9MOLU|nr:J domain-containing protein [Mycoplasma putrefaciens]AGJ90793.1 Hypothetical protein MPUT9231_3790 [Mycoplasma putrefaciens Mput9231]